MNAILGPVRDLVDRRLWPVAVALVVAALAAPVLLADREEAPPAPVAAAPVEEGLSAATIVSVAGPDGVTRRRVLGAPKDPFTPTGKQPRPGGAPTSGTSLAPGAQSGTPAPSPGATTDPFQAAGPVGGSTGGAGAPVTPTPLTGPATPSIPNPAVTAPARPRSPKPEVFSLRVRLNGSPETLKRLEPLPDEDNPAIIYLGVLEDGKTAVFVLDANVAADGDGECHPSPASCQRVYLREGDIEVFDIDGRPLRVELVKIHRRPAKAGGGDQATALSSDRRRALRAKLGRVGRLRYDARTGRLRYLSMRAWRAQVKRAR